MPVYTNPEFLRLPPGARAILEGREQDSFFALPAWYDLMARHGVPAGTEIRLYTDERAGGGAAALLQAAGPQPLRRLASLASFYSVEHGIVSTPGADLAAALDAILSEIVAERPRWDSVTLSEFDVRDPAYDAFVRALRRAGLFVERVFHSGTWYDDTAGLDFSRFLAERPAQLRNTFLRKRRKAEVRGRLKKAFCSDAAAIDQLVADYETVYAASWKPAEGFPDFIPALIRLAAALGALRLGIYYIDGTAAAAQFWIVWHGRAVIYKLAHDRRFDELSLGTLLTMEMFERVLAEDRPREINFGRGDDPYKKMWLPKRREKWGVTAANPQTWRGIRLGLHREAAKFYHRVRGRRDETYSG
jgi:Acetyltransferase (GNAT) domain